MTSQRNYIEELTEKVEAGKKAGKSLDEMKQRLTVASLKSLQSNRYAEFVAPSLGRRQPPLRPHAPAARDVNDNIRDVYNNLDPGLAGGS